MAEQTALQGDLQGVQPALLAKLGTTLVPEGDPNPAFINWKWHPGTVETRSMFLVKKKRMGETGDFL